MAVTKANISVKPMNVTWNGVDLGATEGGLEVSFMQESVELKADQYGAHIIDAFKVGCGIEDITVTLLETDHVKISALFDPIGGQFTPAAGTEVYGMGTGNNFSLMSASAQKLVFHPTANGALVLGDDLAFWKAVPVPGSLSYSGEDMSKATITFKIYPDLTKHAAVQYMAIGDHTQSLPV